MLDSTDPAAGHSLLLADHTTIHLGGAARTLVWADNVADLIDAVSQADAVGTPVLVLGGGSNLVVADGGFDGAVVRVAHRGVVFERAGERVVMHVEAGEIWDDVVTSSLANGLAGLECLSGIPGLAGATPIQNVGAYGAEISNLVTGVRVFDRVDRRQISLPVSDCGFGYRTSRFKAEAGRWLVTEVEFALRPGGESSPRYGELTRTLGLSGSETAPLIGTTFTGRSANSRPSAPLQR